MRSRTERTVLTAIALILVAATAAAWWTSDQWGPHAGPWAAQAWKKITRPGPDTLPPDKRAAAQRSAAATSGPHGAASAPAPQPRKCVHNGRTVYTDQPCPRGSQELVVDGAVTSLPP
ncbi:DUF4124 domain-containing protein [Acidovorax radicis]|uniref:DUF4124 domain-containing protein n=1 Tax=Acidovorax radicis TaxID=758826 RepID=UPI001CF8D22E|nr:DUF4124 domain-containing protein [Acidovorax radicis]UCU99063.1 DUF4124 domain-containing protein [Acidovorax radicis]